jgi:DNA-binding NtrC family response regulator
MKRSFVLIVDDEQGIRHGLENLFRREGFDVYSAADFESALTQVAAMPVDVALVDLRLRTGRSGLDLLAELKRLEPDIIVIVITGYGSIDTAVASLKGGAVDYLLKPIDNDRLLSAVRRHLELRSLKRENLFLKDELIRRWLPHRFITGDPAMQELLQKADMVKDNPVTVLITGESGTGKEILARYIHYTSQRREASFIGINCAGMSGGPSPERSNANEASLSSLMEGRSSSTRSVTCPSRCRPSYCELSRKALSSAWGESRKSTWMSGLSPPPIET